MSQDALPKDKWDAVDSIVDQWRRQRPDLDPSDKHVTGRIVRLGGIIQDAFGAAHAGLDLTESDFGVLVALRRAGAPYELTPTDLARTRMMTSGGMTAALDRLERKGLVVRSPNPADRRGSLVRLTDEAVDLADRAMDAHTAAEHRLVAALTPAQRERLAALLRILLLSLDPQPPGP